MPQIVFCTTCKNRTQHLRLTLPRNLNDNPTAKFVVLNYNTGDELLQYALSKHGAAIKSGKLTVYTCLDEPLFRMAHAKNMAHRLGIMEGGDILVNLDADNMTGPGFDDYLAWPRPRYGDYFLFGNMVKGEMVRGISGRIAVTKGAFLKSGGYDEAKFNGWGSDDKDFNLRLKMIGYTAIPIDASYLRGVAHNDKLRFKEYPELANVDDSFFVVDPSTIKRAVVNDGRIGCGTVYRNADFANPIEIPPVPTRIFGIGMHKTGTTSLHKAFQILGYDSWHWSSAHAAKAIWREMNNQGRSPTLERYHALCDLPIPMLYQQLDKAYPGSKFILTVRPEPEWLASVKAHFDPAFNKWQPGWDQDPFTHRVHNLLYGRKDFDADTMLNVYRRHNAEVEAYFAFRTHSDLLTLNGANKLASAESAFWSWQAEGGWERLCSFLDEPVPTVRYPRENLTNGS